MKLKILLTLFVVLFATSGVATAMYNVNVTPNDQTRWLGNVTGVDSHTMEGGNITLLTIGEQRLTDRWAGFYGNISNNIYLRDNTSSEYLYLWSANTTDIGGEFCASTNASFDFAIATSTAAIEVDWAWNFVSGLDIANNTFTYNDCNISIDQDHNTILNTIRAKRDSGSSTFSTCVIDTAPMMMGYTPVPGDLAFCVDAIQNASTGRNYKNEPVNFEFIVPTNETGTPVTYYFFMELDA